MIRQLYRGLVKYNAETGAAENDLAESIASTDNKRLDDQAQERLHVHQRRGRQRRLVHPRLELHGLRPERPEQRVLHEPHRRHRRHVRRRGPGRQDGPQPAPEPKAKELSGLKKVDDLTFTVKLTEPFSGFPATDRLLGLLPGGRGLPRRLRRLQRDADRQRPVQDRGHLAAQRRHHAGPQRRLRPVADKGKADKLSYKIYADVDAGYAAFQAGELDVMYTIPPARYKEAKSTFGDRMYERAEQQLHLPRPPAVQRQLQGQADPPGVLDGDRPSGDHRRRLRRPLHAGALAVVSPLFDGYRPNVCKYCKLDVTKAKALLAAAGGWKGGKLQLWANAGAGHDAWLQAVGDQLKANLGIDYELKVNLQFPAVPRDGGQPRASPVRSASAGARTTR